MTLLFYMFSFICIIAGLKAGSFSQIFVTYLCTYLAIWLRNVDLFLCWFASSITYLVYFNFIYL